MKAPIAIAAAVGAVGLLLSRLAFSRSNSYEDFSDPNGYGGAVSTPYEDAQNVRDDPSYFFIPEEVEAMPIIASINATPDENLRAFLAMIRKFESNDDYNVIYGGKERFSSYADHPRVYVPINIPGYENQKSSAAGAYQFIWKTWDNLRNRLGLPDFSPASQDAAAIELLREIGALPYIESGDFDTAIRIASKQWASLPYSAAKQNPKSVVAANEFLRRYFA